MTIAELFLMLLLLAGLYFLLAPLRRRLESFLLDWFDPRCRRDRIIDVGAKKADRPSKKE